MEQTLTVKIRLLPSDEQKSLLDDLIRACQNADNFVSLYVFDHTILNKNNTIRKLPSQSAAHDDCYSHLRDAFNLKSQQACNVRKAVLASYKSIQSNNHVLSRPAVYKHLKPELQRGKEYSIFDDYISITTLQPKRAKVRYHIPDYFKPLFEQAKLGSAKLICKHGKYHLHVSVTLTIDDYAYGEFEKATLVGVDRGLRFLMTCYDSKGNTRFYSGKEVREKRKQYKAKRKELQKKGTPSARRRLKEMGSRENRWMDDVNHCLSKALVNAYPKGTIFFLEDLSGIRSALVMTRRKDRYELVSWAYGDLESKLRYKAARRKQQVRSVEAAYSSQECPKCGHVSRRNRDRSRHAFECEGCGYKSNDDRTASMVLLERGREKVLAELGRACPAKPGSGQ